MLREGFRDCLIREKHDKHKRVLSLVNAPSHLYPSRSLSHLSSPSVEPPFVAIGRSYPSSPFVEAASRRRSSELPS
ncbi:hypothetical protein PanWU01x14_043500 [Parasponia andersonii]|uniref:Uncharacterized protein n=1 Tax=Parasponia andersonii TaxID=3476 RepID=A0A2P5DQ09_PARAD|nr:hypothetical protein PanWU01x14_043500 [Parasponia andersonii]